ncbi:MAG: YbaK/EbsC family protein [Planctomycetota bacterium]|jgi:Ala-tRNA(Pro) deacylase
MADLTDPSAAQPDDGPVYPRLADRLRRAGVPFKTTRHEPVYTSAQAAAVRGVDLRSGAKALIVKAGERLVMIVLPADLVLDSKAVKKGLGCKSIRFATKEEVLSITGLEPGSIPPFGGLFDLETYCDERLADSELINFNAGAHTVSISMAQADYLAVEHPTCGIFATAPKKKPDAPGQ